MEKALNIFLSYKVMKTNQSHKFRGSIKL